MLSRKFHTEDDLDFYEAGFPRQPFSRCGLQQGMRDQRCIVFTMLEAIINEKPRTFLLENVPGLETTFKDVLKHILDILKNLYQVDVRVLNALDHGLCQHRPRVYIVGIRKDSVFASQ
jgi:DNA (cytosine-5)-methyltransferase 1